MTDEIEQNEVDETSHVDTPAAETNETARAPQPRRESNPFDYPFVFPGMLLIGALWFGYDGWLNPKTESIMFNRVLFVVFAIACVWTAWVDWRVMKKMQAKNTEAAMKDTAEDS